MPFLRFFFFSVLCVSSVIGIANDDYVYDNNPIPQFVLDQFPEGSLYRQLTTIGQLRRQQADDFLTFIGDSLQLPPKPSLSNFNYETLEDFERANKEYIEAARKAQNVANALFADFHKEFSALQRQEGFFLGDVLQHYPSAVKLNKIVNALGMHAFYPEAEQSLEFLKKIGRFIGGTTIGSPLVNWSRNPSFSLSKSGPNCYGHAIGPNCLDKKVLATPGDYGNKPALPGGNFKYDVNAVLEGLIADGLSLTPLEDSYPIYFLLSDHDYHFYRQDDDGIWSHKPGGMRRKRTDNHHRLITNPMALNLNARGYYCPVCFFWVPKGFDMGSLR